MLKKVAFGPSQVDPISRTFGLEHWVHLLIEWELFMHSIAWWRPPHLNLVLTCRIRELKASGFRLLRTWYRYHLADKLVSWTSTRFQRHLYWQGDSEVLLRSNRFTYWLLLSLLGLFVFIHLKVLVLLSIHATHWLGNVARAAPYSCIFKGWDLVRDCT